MWPWSSTCGPLLPPGDSLHSSQPHTAQSCCTCLPGRSWSPGLGGCLCRVRSLWPWVVCPSNHFCTCSTELLSPWTRKELLAPCLAAFCLPFPACPVTPLNTSPYVRQVSWAQSQVPSRKSRKRIWNLVWEEAGGRERQRCCGFLSALPSFTCYCGDNWKESREGPKG